MKLLGIDIGTSGCKLLVIDGNGNIVQQASREYPLLTPKPGWTEQDPESWWNAIIECLQELDHSHYDGIGVTGQMHGSVFLDSEGHVVRPALLWNDQRTVKECELIESTIGSDRLKLITCNPALTGFQLPKILWLRENEPASFEKVRHVLLPKDYIRYKLSGVLATEVSDASGTGAFSVPKRCWSNEILTELNLEASIFPPSFESDEVSSKTLGPSATGTLLVSGIPIVGGGGDQAAAAVGTGAVVPGVLSVSLGTSGVVFTAIPSAEYDRTGAAHTFCHANRGFHAMGVMLSCGGAVRWYRDTFGAGRSYDEISASASKAVAGCDGLVFMPYLAGERCPHNDPNARAGFHGATLAHDLRHFDRALFEGVTYGLMDCYASLQKLGASVEKVRVTSGGAKSQFWVQMIADVFQANCERMEIDEGPAFGAAILAGVGIGHFENVESATRQVVRVKEVVTRTGEDYRESYETFKTYYPALKNR